jgi:hypothetical protein
MLTVGLLILLSACVMEPGMDSGRKVSVKFAASTGNEAGSDIVLRRAAAEQPETQTVALGKGRFLSATLKPDVGDELRATESLADGQKVYLSAYEAGTDTHVSTVLYTYTGGNLVADGGSELEVAPGTYDFTAYSFYDNTTDTPSTTDVDPAKDLVWGQHANKEITEEDQTVSIVMTHRFARAKVRIGTNIPGAAILAPLGAVSITSSYANLSIPDGVLSKGADIPHTVNFPPFTSTDSIVGYETDTVYPGVKMNIASLIIDVPGQDGTPFTRSGISLGFNSLKGGKSYVLEVSVRQTRWAFSNIYWQAVAEGEARHQGYLTFDTYDNGHQGYQGVYFRCGSLVGISPPTNESNQYSTATPVYIPNYVEGGTSTWSVPETSPYSSLGDISTPYGDGFTYLREAEQNTPEMYAAKKGDICQYLGETDPALEGYYMPRHALGDTYDDTSPMSDFRVAGFLMRIGRTGWKDIELYSYDDTYHADGTTRFYWGFVHQEMGVVLPYSGGGYSSSYFYHGLYYWTSGILYYRDVLTFTTRGLDDDDVVGIDWFGELSATPARCIRKLPEDL